MCGKLELSLLLEMVSVIETPVLLRREGAERRGDGKGDLEAFSFRSSKTGRTGSDEACVQTLCFPF